MKEFTFRLKADTSYLEEQFKNGAKELANLAAQAGKAEKKLEVLQEASVLLSQMDGMLAKVQKKYPNLFEEIFGNVNKQINDALTPLNKMPKEMEKIFGKTSTKLDSLIKSPTAATVSDIKEIGDALKLLAKTMNNTSIDLSFLDGNSKNETKIKKLIAAMQQLEQTAINVGNATNAIGGEVKQPKVKSPSTKQPNAKSSSPKPSKADDEKLSYQQIINTVKELNALSFDESDEAIDKFDEKIKILAKSLGVALDKVAQFDFTDGTIDDVVNNFITTFSHRMPAATEEAASSISNDIGGAMNSVGSAADEAMVKFKALEDKLSEIVRNASKHQLEFSVVLNGEDVMVRGGKSKTETDIVESTGNMMSSLGKYFVDSHTHTLTSKTTNDADLKSFARLKKYGVTDHNAIFGPDGASVYDFSQVNDADMEKAIQMVIELGKSGNVTNEQLSNIFKTLNEGYDVVKHFDADNMGEFAKYIDNVTRNAQASIDPLKQFKGIVDYLTGGRVDWSKHGEALKDFQPENAKNIFDKIVRTATDGKMDIYNFDKKSFADVITELANANSSGQQLTGTLNNVGQVADRAGASIESFGNEIDEALAQETGDLESKLERLKDVAEEYGMSITQRDRNTLESLIDQDNEKELTGAKADRMYELQESIDAADEALAAFEEQYDKIILKLENGKKVEILPNDKGLRDLYKFLDEGDGESFGGISVEDVEYVRKSAEALGKEVAQTAQTTEIVMQQFQDIWKQRKDLHHDLNYNAKYISDDAATEEAKKQIAEYDQELSRLAASYLNLGGSIEDFKSKEKRAFAENEQIQQAESDVNQKLKEQENLYQQVRTAIKGTLEEVVGMDYTAVALEDIEREIKDGLITTLEEAIIRFKEMNNLTDDIAIRPVGEYQRVAEDWDHYQGNKYVGEDERVVNAEEYDSLKQKPAGENIGQEYKDLEALRQKIAEVEKAIIDKTSAFHQEAEAVDVDVKAEIDQLEKLRIVITQIEQAIKDKTAAFVNERQAVDSNVGAEIEKLQALKNELELIASQVQAIGTISLVKQKNKKQEALDGAPLKGEQLTMDLDKATQAAEEHAVAEKKAETAVEQTNQALDEQITKESELIQQRGTLNYLAKEAKDAEKTLSSKWSDDEKESYSQLIETINVYRKSKSKLTDEEIKGIRDVVEGYKLQVNVAKQAQESSEKASKAFGLKELNKATGSKNNLEALGRDFDSQTVTAGLEDMRHAYERLVEAQQKFNDGHEPTDEERIAYQQLTNEYNQAAKSLETLFKASQKMAANSRWSVDIDQSGFDNLEKSMQNAIQASENGRVKFGQFNAETGQLEYSVRRMNGTWDHFTAQVDQAGMAVVGLNGKVKTTNGIIREFTSGVAGKFKNAMQVFSGYDLFFEGIAQVKQGIQYVRDIDTALTELKKVTNETDEAYAQFLQTASKTAGVVGSTVKDITTMTAEWSRLGYDMSQAASLAESTAVLLNVSEFNDAEQASEALISSIQAYGYAADESMDVVNVLNEVGKFIARR